MSGKRIRRQSGGTPRHTAETQWVKSWDWVVKLHPKDFHSYGDVLGPDSKNVKMHKTKCYIENGRGTKRGLNGRNQKRHRWQLSRPGHQNHQLATRMMSLHRNSSLTTASASRRQTESTKTLLEAFEKSENDRNSLTAGRFTISAKPAEFRLIEVLLISD